MSNELARIDKILQTIDDAIAEVNNASAADADLGQMRMLEELLNQADMMGQYASLFALKEAELLVKAASLDDWEQVTRRRDMLAWIRSKSDEEVAAILNECSEGTRIGVIKGRETRAKNAAIESDRQITEFNRINDEIESEFEETGRTTVSTMSYVKRWRLNTAPDPDALTAYCHEKRNRMLKAGAVGLGDDKGTYVNPVSCSRDETRRFVENRLRSIHADLMALNKHCKAANFIVPSSATDMLRSDLDLLESPDDRP